MGFYHLTGSRRRLAARLGVLVVLVMLVDFTVIANVNAQLPTQLATVSVGDTPVAVAVNPSSNLVYVANSHSNTTSVINGSTNNVIATIPVGDTPSGVAVDSSTGMVYVADSLDNNVSVIDGKTNAVVANVPVGVHPVGIAVDSNSNLVYVVNSYGNSVSVIDGSTNNVIATIPVGDTPSGVAVDSSTGMVYVADSLDNNVAIINAATDKQVANVSVGLNPMAVAVDVANDHVYVANYLNDTVSVINGATNVVLANVRVGDYPAGIDLSAPAAVVYVADSADDNVTVIDAKTNTQVGNVSAGANPVAVAVNPITGEVYVADSENDTVSVLGGAVSKTTLSGGSVSINQASTTGVDVVVSGSTSPNGASVTLVSQDLGSVQPSGTGSVSLGSATFFDVKLQGISDGTTRVCITNAAVTSTTVMQYWNGTQWENSADQVVSGTTICGDVPVAALDGTPMVLGTRGTNSAPTAASPSIKTKLSSSSIEAGAAVYDSATLSQAAPMAGGMVYYYSYSNSACSSGKTLVGSVTVSDGVVPNSVSKAFAKKGSYGWDAVYSGDPNNNGAVSKCEPLTVNVSVGQPIKLTVAESGTPATVTLSGCSVSPTSVTANGVAQTVYAKPGCTITAHLPSTSSTRYEGSGGASSFSIMSCSSGTCKTYSATIYHQFLTSVSYTLNGGGTPTKPTFTYKSFGKSSAVALATVAKKIWADAAPYSATNPLGGSSSTQRWFSSAASGTVSSAGPLVITYYRQFHVTFVAMGHGTISQASGWFNAGASISIVATPATSHTFSSWSSSTVSIMIASPSMATTTATINGAGTITATFD